MNNNFDFISKKYAVLIFLLLFMFTMFVIKMFDYLPSNDIEQNSTTETQNISINTETDNTEHKIEEENKIDEEYRNNHKSGHIDFMPKSRSYNDGDVYEEVQAPAGANEEQLGSNYKNINSQDEDKAVKLYISGQDYKNSNDFSNALNTFQQVVNTTNNNELKAMCYESIAEIYSIQNRYETALTFAEKANNLSPSNSREILIYRIQYLSGDTDTVIKNMNKLLQKGF